MEEMISEDDGLLRLRKRGVLRTDEIVPTLCDDPAAFGGISVHHDGPEGHAAMKQIVGLMNAFWEESANDLNWIALSSGAIGRGTPISMSLISRGDKECTAMHLYIKKAGEGMPNPLLRLKASIGA